MPRPHDDGPAAEPAAEFDRALTESQLLERAERAAELERQRRSDEGLVIALAKDRPEPEAPPQA